MDEFDKEVLYFFSFGGKEFLYFSLLQRSLILRNRDSITVFYFFSSSLVRRIQWQSRDYCKAWANKFCNTFIVVYIRNCKQIIKKS